MADDDPTEKLVHNERTKLVATALNNTAVATIVTSFVAPIAGYLYGSSNVSGVGWWFISLIWLFVGLGLHLGAMKVLGRLRP